LLSSSSARHSRRLRRPGFGWPGLVGLAVACLLTCACQATVRIGINANASGGGVVSASVSLDKEAAQAVPDLGQQLRTSDLLKAGWKVVGPTPVAGGGTNVTATKPFANNAELAQVVNDLSGPTGPFHDFHLGQQRSFFSTTTSFSGRVDLTCGLRCFGDQQLQQQLGTDLGIDPTKLQQQAGVILNRVFKFEVAVRLPGSLQSSNAPTQAGNGAVWQPKLGDTATLTANARAVDTLRIVLIAVAALLVIVGAVGLQIRRRGRRSRRR
jgi:hypothetical protein